MSLDLLPQVIYLLLDVMYSFPNKEGASVESFPTAFAIPIGLVKLVQGLWLLDHHDHQVHTHSHTHFVLIYSVNIMNTVVTPSCDSFYDAILFSLSWSEFIWAAPASSCLSLSVWVAAWAGPASTDVPGPTVSGTTILPCYKATDFLHIPGQALPVCTAAQQVRLGAKNIDRNIKFKRTLSSMYILQLWNMEKKKISFVVGTEHDGSSWLVDLKCLILLFINQPAYLFFQVSHRGMVFTPAAL